mmetsp:Transcript_28283/g.81229  ORF Transcript_28283/g.81229 Transcript_28283/m.81229 type:complete len:259 (-) Transcript_28283:333-1109(-)
MHEVERDVPLADLRLVVADQGLPEVREDSPWWRLGLHEPAVVEAQVALREEHRAPLGLVQVPEGGQELREVLHDVAQGVVVVADGVAGAIPVVFRVLLLHLGQDHVHLHDVVHRSEREQGKEALLADLDFSRRLEQASPLLLLKQACVHEQLLEEAPLRVLVEVQSLLALGHAQIVGLGEFDWVPFLVHAVGETVLAVRVQAHEPVDGVEGTNGALELVAHGATGADDPGRLGALHGARAHLAGVAVEQVQVQLREGR